MNIQFEMTVIVFHILFVVAFVVYIRSGKSHLRREQLLPTFFIPIFGPVTGVVIEVMNIWEKQASKSVDLEPLTLGDEVLWVTLKSFHETADIVPLEEAILINDVKVRRRFMLETLYSDPLKYLDVLNIAKYNDDVETSHYATTTISKAQKDFHLSVQKLTVAVESNPDDSSVLMEYIDTLERYIESGLLELHLLKNLRIVYAKMLDRKLEKDGNDSTFLVKKLRNSMELGEFDTAFQIADYLILNHPADERSWIEAIRVSVNGRDGSRLQEIISSMKNQKINWTKDGKEKVIVWLEETKYETQL